MNNKILLAFFILLATLPIFLRELPVGGDSVYFVNVICGKMPFNSNAMPLEKMLFNSFPCDLNFIKILMALNLLFFCFALWHLFKTFNLPNKEIGIILVLSASFITFTLMQFENDFILTLPMLILAISYANRIKNYATIDKNALIAFALIITTGMLWGGSIYYAIFLAIHSILFLPLAIGLLTIYGIEAGMQLLPTLSPIVAENYALYGLFYLGLLFYFFGGIVGLNRKTQIGLIAFLAIAMLNMKFWFLAIPFFAVYALNGWNKIHNKLKENKHFNSKNFEILTITLCLLFITVILIPKNLSSIPNAADIEMIKSAIAINKDVNNQFGLGYFIIYYGGNPSQYGGHDKNKTCGGYCLTDYNGLLEGNCQTLLEKKGTEIKLWKCE